MLFVKRLVEASAHMRVGGCYEAEESSADFEFSSFSSHHAVMMDRSNSTHLQ